LLTMYSVLCVFIIFISQQCMAAVIPEEYEEVEIMRKSVELKQRTATGRVYKGNDCEYIKLGSVTVNDGCTDGNKFVIKQVSGVRKQFLILNGEAVLGFVTKGKKFADCTSYTEVTTKVDCKVVSGLSDVDLSATTTAAAADTTTASADDEVVTRVKGYIDAGTCGAVSANTNCGSSAGSYYKEITYQGKRVIISSQVPDHNAEHDQITTNPNTRCERYQYVQLPLNPTKGSSAADTGMGTVGLAVTGGAFFNHLSNPDGSLAMPNEGPSLDSCFGHSAPGGAYHYHANINCTSAGAATGANDPDKCVKIGYMADGVPVYGFCKDSSGKQMTSCYTLNSGVTTVSVTTAAGTFSGIGSKSSDYSYNTAAFTAGSCNLDSASGAVHPTTNTYSYFMTPGYPWTPIQLYGTEGAQTFCSAA